MNTRQSDLSIFLELPPITFKKQTIEERTCIFPANDLLYQSSGFV